uniref:Uncharacterized protein n=1 Tax=Rhizophora mucronata TaxID=61149 RepID=A0A2P2IYM1_RHIMU
MHSVRRQESSFQGNTKGTLIICFAHRYDARVEPHLHFFNSHPI